MSRALVALLRDYVAADWTMMLAVATLNLCSVITLAESLVREPGGGAVAIDAADRVREWIFE